MTRSLFKLKRLRDDRRKAWRRLSAQLKTSHSLLEIVDDGGIDDLDKSWKRKGRSYPYSCTDEEGLILTHTITREHLVSGFEVATAFGYSTILAATAMRASNGKVRTIDCYVEESTDKDDYSPQEMRFAVDTVRHQRSLGNSPEGLEIAMRCACLAEVSSNVDFNIGLSPCDVADVINNNTIDYAYIDGGHFGEQPLMDFRAVEPFLEDRCAVFFHDNNGNQAVAAAVSAAEKSLGQRAHVFNTRYNLTLVARGIDVDTVRDLDNLCIRNLQLETRSQRAAAKVWSALRRPLSAITDVTKWRSER